MRLTCKQEKLKKALYNIERVAGKHLTLPILENVLLETEGGMLKISATNLEVGAVLKIGAKVEEEGKITVPAGLINNFVSNLPSESNIIFEIKDLILKITSGDYKAKIKGLDAKDFPLIPQMEGDILFNIPAQKIKNIIPNLLSCISVNNTRPELTGVNMLLSEDSIGLAATDSFRLVEFVMPLKQENLSENYNIFISKMNSLIIPAQTFLEISRVITPETEKIDVAIEESQIFFNIDDVKIISRLINGKYPEYKQIIPKKFNTKTILNKDEFLRALRMASIFAGGKSSEVGVELKPKSKEIVIQAESEEIGENRAKIAMEVIAGEADQKIIFNPRYILDGVSSIFTSQLVFLANSSYSPVVLKMADENKNEIAEYSYVIMPIKND